MEPRDAHNHGPVSARAKSGPAQAAVRGSGERLLRPTSPPILNATYTERRRFPNPPVTCRTGRRGKSSADRMTLAPKEERIAVAPARRDMLGQLCFVLHFAIMLYIVF